MSRAGDTVDNPVSGEWIVVRLGTEDSGASCWQLMGTSGPAVPSSGSTSTRPSRKPLRL